jgi:hypothetical protein
MFAALRASSSSGVRAFSSTARAAVKMPLRAHGGSRGGRAPARALPCLPSLPSPTPASPLSQQLGCFCAQLTAAETPVPADLLTKIGRNADKKLAEKVPDWKALTELYFKGTKPMGDAGLTPRERRCVWCLESADGRYVMWALERYSHGDAPSTFIRPPKPPKKIRG